MIKAKMTRAEATALVLGISVERAEEGIDYYDLSDEDMDAIDELMYGEEEADE
jgi:hypothetical protein